MYTGYKEIPEHLANLGFKSRKAGRAHPEPVGWMSVGERSRGKFCWLVHFEVKALLEITSGSLKLYGEIEMKLYGDGSFEISALT